MVRVENGLRIKESEVEFNAFFSGKDWVHYVMKEGRPGVRSCLETLEQTHYPPKTPRNRLFVARVIEWIGVPWFIVSIPENEKEFMDRAATANGLKAKRGRPKTLKRSLVGDFPISGPNIFTLENIKGHPIYRHARK